MGSNFIAEIQLIVEFIVESTLASTYSVMINNYICKKTKPKQNI